MSEISISRRKALARGSQAIAAAVVLPVIPNLTAEAAEGDVELCGDTEYYVDAVNGSDSNSGLSRTTPWQNLSKVANYPFAFGDFVFFKSGQTWEPKSFVTFVGGVHYATYGGHAPALFGGAIPRFPFRITGNEGSIENIVFQNSNQTGLVLNAPGKIPGETASHGWTFSYCRFTGSTLHGCQQFNGGEGSDYVFRHCEFDGNQLFGAAMGEGLINSLFEDCSAHDNGITGITIYGWGQSSKNTLRRVSVYRNGQDGLGLGPNLGGAGGDDLIEDCIAYLNGLAVNDRTGIKTFLERTTIRRCVSHSNCLGFNNGHGIQVDFGAKDCRVYENTTYKNRNSGISITGTGHDIVANVSIDNFGSGLEFFGKVNNDLNIQGNVFIGNGFDSVQIHAPRRAFKNAKNIKMDGDHIFDPSPHANLISWNGKKYPDLSSFNRATGLEARGRERPL